MGVLARMAGNGFGSKWNVPWIPEALFTLPIGITASWAANIAGLGFGWSLVVLIASWAISYGGMQSATWAMLPWDDEGVRDPNRQSTMRPIVDWVAEKLKFPFDSEKYAWTWGALKGFIITLPIGGILGAGLFPLGYEIGSHAKGRTNKFIDPHVFAEFFSGVGVGVAIFIFVEVVQWLTS